MPLNSVVRGISFDGNDWDKNNIFVFENFISYPIVTEKLKGLMEKNKISNLKFIEPSTFDVCY